MVSDGIKNAAEGAYVALNQAVIEPLEAELRQAHKETEAHVKGWRKDYNRKEVLEVEMNEVEECLIDWVKHLDGDLPEKRDSRLTRIKEMISELGLMARGYKHQVAELQKEYKEPADGAMYVEEIE